MKTPAQAYQTPIPSVNPEIEAHIDAVLDRPPTTVMRGERVWAIPATRSGWTTDEIAAVLVRYREVGWTTMIGGGRDMMYYLSCPV